MSSFDTIRVLFLSPNFGLYGIPYDMRPGQQPGDLWRSTSYPDTLSRKLGARISAPGPRADWILLDRKDPAVREFLRGKDVPDHPYEWTTVSAGRTFGAFLIGMGAGYGLARAVDNPEKVRSGFEKAREEAKKISAAAKTAAGRSGGDLDTSWRYAPAEVMTRYGRLPVLRAVFHNAGAHKGPIAPEMGALELITEKGSRWYGFQRGMINAELRMIVSGFNPRFEEVAAWKKVPKKLAPSGRVGGRSGGERLDDEGGYFSDVQYHMEKMGADRGIHRDDVIHFTNLKWVTLAIEDARKEGRPSAWIAKVLFDAQAPWRKDAPSWMKRGRSGGRSKADGPWVPASGGTEEPFTARSGKRLQYMFQPSTGRHAYLDVDADIILDDEDALKHIEGRRRR